MYNYVEEYYWKEGVPRGIRSIPENREGLFPRSFRIVIDPYRKRILLEKYFWGVFDSLVYDSALFDFRQLKGLEEGAWKRETIYRSEKKEETLLRDPIDRVILRECIDYRDGEPISCALFSVHGIPLSHHKIFSQKRGDSWNGVILYDRQRHPILWKEYLYDEQTSSFTTLLQEEWNMVLYRK